MHGPGMWFAERDSFRIERELGISADRSEYAEGLRNEALGKSLGLRDNLAKPEGVFLFRYEPNALVRALGQPIASATSGGFSPIVYRFNLRDGKSNFLAQQFSVEDKDVIFAADAPAVRSYKFATLLSSITGPIITGLLVCQTGKC